MKKILQWHENFYPIEGGGPAHINNLIYNIKKDYQHEIITDYVENYPRVETLSKNAVIRRFPYVSFFYNTKFIKTRIISFPCRLMNELYCLQAKFDYLRKTKFDVLHVHGIIFYNAILKLNYITQKNLYQRIIDYSFIKNPKILTLHNFFPGFTNEKIVIDAYNHYIDQFDNIICVNQHIYDYCIKYSSEKNYHKNIHFIPNSIDIVEFYYAPIKLTCKLKVGFTGRLVRSKDLAMINRLLSNLPKEVEFYFAVTGDTTLLKTSKDDNNRVRIFKNLSQNEMAKFYHGIDVLFNSTLNDGVGRVTLEAMACGRPVIMYKSTNRFPVINGQTGYLVDRNLNEILDCFNYVCQNRKELKKLGLNARKIVVKEYSNDVIIPRIKKIYENSING